MKEFVHTQNTHRHTHLSLLTVSLPAVVAPDWTQTQINNTVLANLWSQGTQSSKNTGQTHTLTYTHTKHTDKQYPRQGPPSLALSSEKNKKMQEIADDSDKPCGGLSLSLCLSHEQILAQTNPPTPHTDQDRLADWRSCRERWARWCNRGQLSRPVALHQNTKHAALVRFQKMN